MKKAIGYVRVSTEGQVDQYGLETQIAAMYEFAEKMDIEIVEIKSEEGVSGTKSAADRIALAEVFMFLDDNPDVEIVLIPALDRLARDIMIQETIIRDIRKRGLEIISVREPDLCSDDPSRKLIRQIMGAINEYERDMIVARMKAGRITKAKKGQHATGRIPMGYTSEVVDGRRTLVKNDLEAEVVRLCFELRYKGLSFRKIAAYLNDGGYTPKNSTEEQPTYFYDSTVRKILANPKYHGIVELHDGELVIATSNNEALRLV